MNVLSAVEMTELGKSIRAWVTETYGEGLSKEALNKAVDEKVREILRKSTGRGAEFVLEHNPQMVFEVEKRILSPAGDVEVNKSLQDLNDDLYLLMKIANVGQPELLKSWSSQYKDRWTSLRKALNTATSGSGLEWVPTGFSNQMIESIMLETTVAKLFYSFNMPTNPFTFPLFLDDGEAYLGGQVTTDSPSMFPASTPDTDSLTFAAKKLVANYPIADEMTEDSAISVLPILRMSIARALARAKDNAIVNGDTSSAHMDTGYSVAARDARRAWLGLRKMCMSDLKQSGSSWAGSTGLALINGLVEDFGKYGIRPKDLALLVGTNGYSKVKNVDQIRTVDKVGNAATIIDGEVKKIDGIEIVVSEYVRENLNNSGIYDGVTVTDTQMILVNKKCFWEGVQKQVTIDFEQVKREGISYLIAQQRCIWQSIYDYTTEPMIGWLYDITK